MRNRLLNSSDGQPRRSGDLIVMFGFAYVLMTLLVAIPIYNANIWSILGNTRLMVPLINSGVIAYHDLDLGFVDRGGEMKEYYKAQQPIEWWLVGVVALIYLVVCFLKAVQFHDLARFFGLKGSLGQHARAYYYGAGLNTLLPYSVGDMGTVRAIEGQGESRQRASSAVFTQEMFVGFAIAFYLVLLIILAGWETSFKQTLPALVIWGFIYFMMRPALKATANPQREGYSETARGMLQSLADHPLLLTKLSLMWLVIVALNVIAPYVISQAFTTGPVILNVPLVVILGGVVAGHIATRVPLTPGNIGVYELAFGTALYMAGVGIDVAVTIAILEGVIRHLVALSLFLIVRFGFHLETSLSDVLKTLMGHATTPSTEVVLAGEKV